MTRPVKKPARFDDFIDGRIAAEYLEEDFILFEDYMIFTGNVKDSPADDPHANSEFLLAKFHDFEKFMKRESRKRAELDAVGSQRFTIFRALWY